ncbi:MAG: glycosyltransferase [bacterium]|nr:glycosyltransferase [bacterium]
MKILFIAPYPFDEAPSQRFRFEQYFKILEENSIEYDFKPFLDQNAWRILYKSGNIIKKVGGILRGFNKRLALIFRARKYKFIFIHREATPLGPPFIEWILAKFLRKKIIYDFDDAIWLSNTSSSNKIASSLKNHQKVLKICKWSYRISVGNSYLKEFALQFNDNVILNPTTIDTEQLHNKSLVKGTKKDQVFRIGWTGTHSTLKYIEPIFPVLDDLIKKSEFKFVIISNQPPNIKRPYIEFIPWSKETEITDLAKFDIGLMPLEDDIWARGKCGFKALQYMALEIPALVSPVGVNSKIVDHGMNGFICDTPEQWHDNIKVLMANSDARKRMGVAGREKIIDEYSVLSNKQNFLDLFN